MTFNPQSCRWEGNDDEDDFDFDDDLSVGISNLSIAQRTSSPMLINPTPLKPATLSNFDIELDLDDLDFGDEMEAPKPIEKKERVEPVLFKPTDLDELKDLKTVDSNDTLTLEDLEFPAPEPTAQRPKPTLISPETITSLPKTVHTNEDTSLTTSSTMVFDPVKMCWVGNEEELDAFSSLSPVSLSPKLGTSIRKEREHKEFDVSGLKAKFCIMESKHQLFVGEWYPTAISAKSRQLNLHMRGFLGDIRRLITEKI